jgi:hypothetical protein
MADIGASFGLVEQIANLGEGSLRKYVGATGARQFTLNSLLQVCTVLGLRVTFTVDEELTRRMKPQWEMRDLRMVHARRQPSLGPATLKRILKPAAAELGRRGGKARMAATTPEQHHKTKWAGTSKRGVSNEQRT